LLYCVPIEEAMAAEAFTSAESLESSSEFERDLPVLREDKLRHSWRRKIKFGSKRRRDANVKFRGKVRRMRVEEWCGHRWPHIVPEIESVESAYKPLFGIEDHEYTDILARQAFDNAIRREGRARRLNGLSSTMIDDLRDRMDEEEDRWGTRFKTLNERQRGAAARFLRMYGRLPHWIRDESYLDIDFVTEYDGLEREAFEHRNVQEVDQVPALRYAS
jgi:hypothetical protein